ncbi:MAG: hypothetical protein ACRDZ7_20480 [Acidimicrobiia bacterium]
MDLNRFRVRAGFLIVMSGLAALPLTAVARAAEGGRTPALCTFEVHDTFSGYMVTPSEGTGHGIGTMTCLGTLKGRQLTGGPGHFEWWFSYAGSDVPAGGNTCAFLGGKGIWEAHLPTVGSSALILTGSWSYIGTVAGQIRGQLGGFPVEMVYETYLEPEHLDENCVTAPNRHAVGLGQGTVG